MQRGSHHVDVHGINSGVRNRPERALGNPKQGRSLCGSEEDRSYGAARHAPLSRHVRIYPPGACDQAKNCAARLAGVEPPKYEDSEKTFTEPKARIAKTVAYVKTLDAKKIDASADREITFPLGPNNKGHMKGADYLNHFSVPNFYFHLTTAYDILRHCGVEIGKRDFLGATKSRDRAQRALCPLVRTRRTTRRANRPTKRAICRSRALPTAGRSPSGHRAQRASRPATWPPRRAWP
jgi:hypothetical protein